MKWTIPVTVMTAWLLAACAIQPGPTPTLAERLQGKTPQERQEILRLECLTEAQWRDTQRRAARRSHGLATRSSVSHYDPEVSRWKALCRQMTDAYLMPGDEE